MIRAKSSAYVVATAGLLVAATWVPSCGGTSGNQMTGTGGAGGGNSTGSGGGTGNPDGGGSGTGGAGAPSPKCAGAVMNAAAAALDFTNNLIPSPAPPGNLTTATAPQIVVFGWDDVESEPGLTFVSSIFATLKNPDGSQAKCNLNPNACYGEGGAPPPGKYTCGDGTLSLVKTALNAPQFDIGNHTIDHLEGYEVLGGWSGIPPQYKDMVGGGWVFHGDQGPGTFIDLATWKTVLMANDAELKSLYMVTPITGFRAPRLEINDNGLNALKAVGYTYDQNLEEILPEPFVEAAITVNTDAKKGFNWIPWPYTLDNGSPGIWNQQVDGSKANVINYPTGVWEIPVYMVYLPTAGGLGTAVANAMLASDAPTNCIFPPDTAADQKKHCYLAEGELKPGDVVKEVTGFDFNTFIYSRMTAAQWLAAMKYTFLIRYYGNRAPMTYGAHPVEYTSPYDSFTLAVQGNNYGYRDVLKYTTYLQRQQATKDFVAWIKSDPTYSKDTYFLSASQLADYMKAPFDKAGAKAAADTMATPDSNGIFTRLTWKGQGATLTATDGNTADIAFTVPNTDTDVSVVAGVVAGSLKTLSHIDIKYTTDVPFRVRLLTSDGTPSVTALLAGVGGDRLARIRIKDFFPALETNAAKIGAMGLVGADYMAKVNGIAIETAVNTVTGAKPFKTHIDQLTLHGADTAALCAP